MTTPTSDRRASGAAVTALVLAVLVPPVGLVLGLIANRRGASPLAFAAVVLGMIGTVLGTIIVISLTAGTG